MCSKYVDHIEIYQRISATADFQPMAMLQSQYLFTWTVSGYVRYMRYMYHAVSHLRP